VPESLSPAALAAIDRATFARDGYLLVPQFVGTRTIQSLVRAIHDLVRAGRHLTADANLHGAQYQVQSASGRPADGAVEPGAFRKITFPHKAHRRFAMLRHDERIQEALRALGLGDARCVVDQVNLKLPRVGTSFPWHQDAAFLAWRQRSEIEARGGANIVLALDPADEENGTFEVLPGTHLAGLRNFDYDLAGGEANAPAFDGGARVVLDLAPGDAVFFHPHLAHGSGVNRSDRPRRCVALWFIAGEE
jgi:ectoine hydroxylase-related dioxygenase (phytanoyl-CoA dioxygenase family)